MKSPAPRARKPEPDTFIGDVALLSDTAWA